MTAVLIGCGLWLAELYTDPTWAKIRSFLLGYFLGTFVMEWVWQRASRGLWASARLPPDETAERSQLPPAVAPQAE